MHRVITARVVSRGLECTTAQTVRHIVSLGAQRIAVHAKECNIEVEGPQTPDKPSHHISNINSIV